MSAGGVLLTNCAIDYPPPADDLRLRAITTLVAFRGQIGWSDHTIAFTANAVAVTLDACEVEQ